MSDSNGAGTGDEQDFDFPHGIDPELIPYLIAADEDDDEDDESPGDVSEGDEDQSDLEQLRRIVKETLLAGADPELVSSILSDVDDEHEEVDPEALRAAEHEVLLDEAEAEAELNVVYQDLITRTPEHDFDPTLDRVQQVLYILGDPQDAYPVLHIAGTNGKTSTTRLSAALLSGFGLRTGTFTSPHLMSVRERIQVNGQPLSAREFLSAWNDVSPYIDMVDAKAEEAGTPKISYFEALAITAFAAFADIPVDAAVIEGGRFDATNVVNSGVQIITPISYDHQKYLGNTIEEIAGEKAQIIKSGSIVVVSRQDSAALEVIEEQVLATDSIMRLQDRDWAVESRQPGVGGQMISVRTPAALYEELFIPLHGEHQAQNAAAALVAVEAIMGGKALPPEVVENGFLQARSPGRLEIVRRSPTVIVDAAHNPAGVAAMRAGLAEAFQLYYLVGVFSAMADKNIEAMLVEIEPVMDQIVLTQMQGSRPIDVDDLKEIAVSVFGEDRVHVKPDLADALDEAAKLMDAPMDPSLQRAVVAFGSIMLAGDVTALFQR